MYIYILGDPMVMFDWIKVGRDKSPRAGLKPGKFPVNGSGRADILWVESRTGGDMASGREGVSTVCVQADKQPCA